MAMAFSMIVEMTSLTPRVGPEHAGISAHSVADDAAVEQDHEHVQRGRQRAACRRRPPRRTAARRY